MRRGSAALSRQAWQLGWREGAGWRKGRPPCATPCFLEDSALAGPIIGACDHGCQPLPRPTWRPPGWNRRCKACCACKFPSKSMGGRGAVPDATPSLPANAGQSPVNPGVRRCLQLWRPFDPLAATACPTPRHTARRAKPNETRGGARGRSFAPPCAFPPPLRPCAHWSLQTPPDAQRQRGPEQGDLNATPWIDARPKGQTPHTAGRLDQPS